MQPPSPFAAHRKDLAALAKTSQPDISIIESGKRSPTVDTLERLSALLAMLDDKIFHRRHLLVDSARGQGSIGKEVMSLSGDRSSNGKRVFAVGQLVQGDDMGDGLSVVTINELHRRIVHLAVVEIVSTGRHRECVGGNRQKERQDGKQRPSL